MIRRHRLKASDAVGGYALGISASLFLFLLFLKLCLLWWFLGVKHLHPLADVPHGRGLLVIGGDAFVCFGAACALFVVLKLSRLHPLLRIPVGRIAPAVGYAAIVIFSAASFQVTRIYRSPLEIELLRSADDMMLIGNSIRAYVTILPVMLILAGLVSYIFPARWISVRLSRLRQRTQIWVWGVTGLVCFGLVLGEFVGLRRIDTFGVKDNAVLFFARNYTRPFRPIDAPGVLASLNGRVAGHEEHVRQAGRRYRTRFCEAWAGGWVQSDIHSNGVDDVDLFECDKCSERDGTRAAWRLIYATYDVVWRNLARQLLDLLFRLHAEPGDAAEHDLPPPHAPADFG